MYLSIFSFKMMYALKAVVGGGGGAWMAENELAEIVDQRGNKGNL